MNIRPETLQLYLVTERSLAAGRSLTDVVLAAVAGGVTIVQIREKAATTRAFIEQARALKTALNDSGVPLIVNDRVDVALAIGADGVHLGDDDMPCPEARRILGPTAIIGVSLAAAPGDGFADADYFAASPVFATDTKPDAGPALGLAGVAMLRRAVDRPLVAIGGIDQHNAARIIAAGADGIAVVSAIMAADDPTEAAAQLKTAVTRFS
ncbi:thiamine phosphate synthase [Telmatospirillum sp.]|uniref:thiamine phosphate synthase n=1 Tax=Telmatospirillum sp. TaxID=2079197 RepID=UPI002844FE4D|nr:thiamine phosphate synthase [Telmatospirillum sp.]MDR3436268.1 thiamine phosphate synthase [Telmatospirillum sp.]